MKLSNIATDVTESMIGTQVDSRLLEENKALKIKLESSLTEGECLLDIVRIRPSFQVRQTFLEQDIQERSISLLEEGQASPLILIALKEDPDHDYEIEDGELTWRAAHLLVEQGNVIWKQLKCCLSKLSSSEDSHTKSIVHHCHKVELNPLDKAEGLIVEIYKAVEKDVPSGKEPAELAALLKPVLGNLSTKYQTNSIFSELYISLLTSTKEEARRRLEAVSVEFELDAYKIEVLLSCKRFLIRNLQTFYKKRLPLVFLPLCLKQAIRDSKNPLSINHAEAISRIKDEQLQQDLIDQCQANSWSLKELKAAITDIRQANEPAQKAKLLTFTRQKTIVSNLTKSLNSASIKSLTPKQALTLADSLQRKVDALRSQAGEELKNQK